MKKKLTISAILFVILILRVAIAGEGVIASYYSNALHGRLTASGEKYDKNKLTAAHKTYSFGTVVKITNLNNNRTVEVRINDKGPFVKGRVIDLSYAAALKLDMIKTGTAPVRIEIRSLP